MPGWAVIGLVASMMLTLFLEVHGDRKELRAGLESIRAEIGTFRDSVRQELNGVRGEMSELKVTVARMDERLKTIEARFQP